VGEKGGYCKQTISDHPSTPFLDKSSAGYQLAPQQVLLAAPSKQEPPPVFNHSLTINITKVWAHHNPKTDHKMLSKNAVHTHILLNLDSVTL
jgi:hypothetical protein